MPWFPIPFVLNEHGDLKTEDYRYTEVNWNNGVPPSLVSMGASTVRGFSLLAGNDLGTTTPPANKKVVPAIVTDMEACREVSFKIRPRLHMLDYDAGNKIPVYTITYKLKMRKNPESKTDKKTFKARFCTSSIIGQEIRYCRQTSEYGAAGTWQGEAEGYTYLWQKVGYVTLSLASHNTTVVNTQHSIGKDITHHALDMVWEQYPYDEYNALAKADVYDEYEITFNGEDSYVYVVLNINFTAPQTSLGHTKFYYKNYDTTSNIYGYAGIELENEDDVIYGDGFSNIYLGSTNVEPGMMFNGEIEPTEIYIGENLVWSN